MLKHGLDQRLNAIQKLVVALLLSNQLLYGADGAPLGGRNSMNPPSGAWDVFLKEADWLLVYELASSLTHNLFWMVPLLVGFVSRWCTVRDKRLDQSVTVLVDHAKKLAEEKVTADELAKQSAVSKARAGYEQVVSKTDQSETAQLMPETSGAAAESCSARSSYQTV